MEPSSSSAVQVNNAFRKPIAESETPLATITSVLRTDKAAELSEKGSNNSVLCKNSPTRSNETLATSETEECKQSDGKLVYFFYLES